MKPQKEIKKHPVGVFLFLFEVLECFWVAVEYVYVNVSVYSR